MAEDVDGERGGAATLRTRARLPEMVLLLFGTLGISTAYGMLLLLPLYVQRLGGNEADFGVVMASATVTAAVSIGLVIRYPEALRANVVLAIAVLLSGFGAAGAALVRGTWLPLVGIGLLLGTAWAVVYAASPMLMSEMVTDRERVTHFGYLTGTQQLGIGVGPVVAGFLTGAGSASEEPSSSPVASASWRPFSCSRWAGSYPIRGRSPPRMPQAPRPTQSL